MTARIRLGCEDAGPPRASGHGGRHQRYPEVLKDKDRFWTASNLYFVTVANNTNLVKDPPRRFADMLDPKWKGQMAWTSELAVQGAPGFIHNVLTVMGEDSGMAYLKQALIALFVGWGGLLTKTPVLRVRTGPNPSVPLW